MSDQPVVILLYFRMIQHLPSANLGLSAVRRILDEDVQISRVETGTESGGAAPIPAPITITEMSSLTLPMVGDGAVAVCFGCNV